MADLLAFPLCNDKPGPDKRFELLTVIYHCRPARRVPDFKTVQKVMAGPVELNEATKIPFEYKYLANVFSLTIQDLQK